MNNIDKIIISSREPMSTGVLWVDSTTDRLMYFNNGSWKQVNNVDLTNELQDRVTKALANQVKTGDASTLTKAKQYTDTKTRSVEAGLGKQISEERIQRSNAVDAAKSSAKSYTDEVTNALDDKMSKYVNKQIDTVKNRPVINVSVRNPINDSYCDILVKSNMDLSSYNVKLCRWHRTYSYDRNHTYRESRCYWLDSQARLPSREPQDSQIEIDGQDKSRTVTFPEYHLDLRDDVTNTKGYYYKLSINTSQIILPFIRFRIDDNDDIYCRLCNGQENTKYAQASYYTTRPAMQFGIGIFYENRLVSNVQKLRIGFHSYSLIKIYKSGKGFYQVSERLNFIKPTYALYNTYEDNQEEVEEWTKINSFGKVVY